MSSRFAISDIKGMKRENEKVATTFVRMRTRAFATLMLSYLIRIQILDRVSNLRTGSIVSQLLLRTNVTLHCRCASLLQLTCMPSFYNLSLRKRSFTIQCH